MFIALDIWEFVRVALIAIRTNKVRSLLTMLGVIIGVASVILLVSIGSGLQAFVTRQFAALGSNLLYVMPGKLDLKNSSSIGGSIMQISKFELLDVSDLNRAGGAIKQTTPVVMSFGNFSYKGESVQVETIGCWESFFQMSSFTPRWGKIISQSDVERGRKAVVLGSKPAEDLFGKDVNPVGKFLTLNDVRYEVVGVLESKGGGGGLGASIDNHAFLPLTTALRLFNQTKPYMLYVEAINQDEVAAAADQTKRILLKRLKADDFTVMQQTELLNTINQFLGVITIALGGIASISLLVGGIGIMNIMLVSVTERTREIGLRKAVGATPRAILAQFLIEAVILSLVGGTIGILLGTLGSLALSQAIQTEVTGWSVVLAFGFSAVVGIVFGVAPALRAARLNPIDALRYE